MYPSVPSRPLAITVEVEVGRRPALLEFVRTEFHIRPSIGLSHSGHGLSPLQIGHDGQVSIVSLTDIDGTERTVRGPVRVPGKG